ncbi:MAG: hypothetical protein ACHQYQ_10560 [Bacteriovoracales bacterium]
MERWNGNYEKIEVQNATDLNIKEFVNSGLEPAYKDGSRVVEFKLAKPEEFVRVHGTENRVKPWLMKAEDIKGLSVLEIKNKFNLPNIPSSISKVEVPIGTNMRMSMVGSNKFGEAFGAIQYEIRMPEGVDLPDNWFSIIGEIK